MKKVDVLKLFILSFLLCFISCENFMGSDGLKEDIEKKIIYESSIPFNVYSVIDQKIGNFITETEKKVRVTDEIKITFQLTSLDYVCNNEWKIYSANDSNKLLNNVLEITKTEVLDDKYSVYVKIKENSEDIIISPVCYFVSKLTGYSPVNEYGSFVYTTPILLQFNTPIASDSFANFKNLEIKNSTNGTNLSNYFAEPVISDDGLSVSVIAKEEMYDYVKENPNLSIDVLVKLTEVKFKNENTQALKDNIKWSYQINQEIDKTDPEITSLHVALNADDFADCKYIDLNNQITQNNERDYMCNSLYFTINAFDNLDGAGIRSLIIKEKCIAVTDSSGKLSTDNFNSDNEIESEIVLYSQLDDKKYLDNYSYVYKLKHYYEGEIIVSFLVKDNSGNTSKEKKVTVIKSTELDFKTGSSIYFSEDCTGPRKSDSDGYDSFNFFPRVCVGSITDTISSGTKSLDKSIYIKSESETPAVTISKVLSGTTTENLVELTKEKTECVPIREYQHNYYEWFSHYKIKRDSSKDTYIKVWMEDFIGNTDSWTTVLQKNVDVLDVSNVLLSDGRISADIVCSEAPLYKFILYYDIYDENGNYINTYESSTQYNSQTFRINESLYGYDKCKIDFYVAPVMRSSFASYHAPEDRSIPVSFYGCIGMKYKYYAGIPMETVPVASGALPDFNVAVSEPVKNKGTRTVSVIYSNDFIPAEGCVYYTKYWEDGSSDYQTTLSKEVELESLKKWNISIEVKNRTGGIGETSYKSVELNYDNIPPVIDLKSVKGTGLHYNKTIEIPVPFDAGVGINYDEKNISKIKVYYSNKGNLTEEEIKSNPCLDFSYNKNDDHILVSRFGHNELYSYIVAEDKNGNCCYTQVILDSYPLIYVDDPYKLVFNRGEDVYSAFDEKDHYTLYFDYISKQSNLTSHPADSRVLMMTEDGGVNNRQGRWSAKNNGVEFFFCPEEDTCSAFYKVLFTTYKAGNSIDYYPIRYIYPAYMDPANGLTGSAANLVYGTNGFTVISDMPCMVMTLSSYENYGTDEDSWVTKGSEFNIKINNKSFNYVPDTESVPEGYYYVVYAWFADGSTTMSQVYRK